MLGLDVADFAQDASDIRDPVVRRNAAGERYVIVQGAAFANEIRTPALWGLRFRRPLLHDGTAATPDDAIRRHTGEGALARMAFEVLCDAGRAALFAFLGSL